MREYGVREQEEETKREIFKHSAAIHIHNNITLLQRRTWNVLLFNAYNELESQEEHHIRLLELATIVGYDSHDFDYLKESTKAMMNCIVEWDILGKDGSPEWGATVLLAQAEIKRGILTYAYSPALRRRLHNPSIYARLDLNLQKRFDSKYGLALWEICTDYLGSSREYGETPFIELDEYRKLIGIREGGYPQFKEFNRCAVKEPVTEINRVSDFQVTVDYKRQGRKVVALKFKMRRIALLPAPDFKQGSLFPPLEDMPLMVKELKDVGLSAQDAWEVWQRSVDYVTVDPKPTVEAFEEYVREKIHLLKKRQREGKVSNVTGFLLEAIKKNYANPEFADAEKQKLMQQEREARVQRERRRKRLEDEKAQLEKSRRIDIHAVCKDLIANSPALAEEALKAVLAKDDSCKKHLLPGRTAAENYREVFLLTTSIDPWLETHYPDHFADIRVAHDPRLAEIKTQLVELAD